MRNAQVSHGSQRVEYSRVIFPRVTVILITQSHPDVSCRLIIVTALSLEVNRVSHSAKSLHAISYLPRKLDRPAPKLELTGNFSLIYFRKQGSSFHVRNKFSGCNVRCDRSLQQGQHHGLRLRAYRKVNYSLRFSALLALVKICLLRIAVSTRESFICNDEQMDLYAVSNVYEYNRETTAIENSFSERTL